MINYTIFIILYWKIDDIDEKIYLSAPNKCLSFFQRRRIMNVELRFMFVQIFDFISIAVVASYIFIIQCGLV